MNANNILNIQGGRADAARRSAIVIRRNRFVFRLTSYELAARASTRLTGGGFN